MEFAPLRQPLILGLACAGLLAAVGGCASGPSPEPALTRAEVAIEEANEAQAGEYSPAPLALARDKFARAREAAESGNNQTAIRLAEQATADAELAEADARADIAQRNLAEMRESVGVLREEALEEDVPQ